MKKFFIALIGGTVFLIGVAMLILPGPGLLVIVAALGILATEFLWAKRALQRAKDAVASARHSGGWRSWLPWRKKSGPPVVPSHSFKTTAALKISEGAKR